MNIYLINPQQIINSSLLDDNVDIKILSKTLEIAQEVSLKPILGSTLYNLLLAENEANISSGATVSQVYVDMMDKIKPFLISQVVADYITTGTYRISAKGVFKSSDTSAIELQENELSNLKKYYLNQVSTFKVELINWLKENHLLKGSKDTTPTASFAWYIPNQSIVHNHVEVESDIDISNYSGSTGSLSYTQIKESENTLLITPKKLINTSLIDDNVDKKQIARIILTVQQVNLKPILTTPIYNELMYGYYQVLVSGGTLNALYSDLHGIVKNYLIHKVVAESTMLTYRFGAKGVIKNTDTNATEVDSNELNNVKNYYDNISTTYKGELIDFLKKYGLTKCYGDNKITSEAINWYLPSSHTHSITPQNDLTTLSSLVNGTDTFTTGGTFSNNVLSLVSNTGDNISISGFSSSSLRWFAEPSTAPSVLPIALNNSIAIGEGAEALNYNQLNFGFNAGVNSAGAESSTFIGVYAGNGAVNAYYSNFIGSGAGLNASEANYSNFLGTNAGYLATNAFLSNFMGYTAGFGAANADYSNFIGSQAGYGATEANNSNFLGNNAGNNAYGANASNFIGLNAGANANNASSSNLIGFNAGATFTNNNIGSNNTIIGSNISLLNGTSNAFNIGGVLFANTSGSNNALR